MSKSTNGDAPADGGPALFRVVRFWSRRWMHRVSAGQSEELRRAQHIQVVEAVAAVEKTTTEATVNSIAHELGLDQSGASRMVRDATAAGYLERAESAIDRRRTVLHLTDRGEQLRSAARDWQRTVFAELTATWRPDDRRRFAEYLQRLSAELGA